jgi:hypothetical protein
MALPIETADSHHPNFSIIHANRWIRSNALMAACRVLARVDMLQAYHCERSVVAARGRNRVQEQPLR